MERVAFSGWVYISRAESVPGEWIAHCLDFDIVTQGSSPQQALAMAREAVEMCIADDLNSGLNPFERRADPEDWAPLYRLFEHHAAIPVDTMDRTTFNEFAVQMTFELVRLPAANKVTPAEPRQQPTVNPAVAA